MHTTWTTKFSFHSGVSVFFLVCDLYTRWPLRWKTTNGSDFPVVASISVTAPFLRVAIVPPLSMPWILRPSMRSTRKRPWSIQTCQQQTRVLNMYRPTVDTLPRLKLDRHRQVASLNPDSRPLVLIIRINERELLRTILHPAVSYQYTTCISDHSQESSRGTPSHHPSTRR